MGENTHFDNIVKLNDELVNKSDYKKYLSITFT